MTPTLTGEQVRALKEAATPSPLISGHDQDEKWAVALQHGAVIAVMAGPPGKHNEANANLYAAAHDLAAECLERGVIIAEQTSYIGELEAKLIEAEAQAIFPATLERWETCLRSVGSQYQLNCAAEIRVIIKHR